MREKIDILTGNESDIYSPASRGNKQSVSLDYTRDYGPRYQFWRKYFNRLNKGDTELISRLFDWIKQGSNFKSSGKRIHNFFKIPDGREVESIRLFKLTDNNYKPNTTSRRVNGVVEFKRGESNVIKGPTSRKNTRKKIRK